MSPAGRYRARDLLLLPSLLSLARIPLGLAFMVVSPRPAPALTILFLGGLTDVLDGFFARRLGQATPTGAVVDGVLDKLFAAMIIGTLVGQERLSLLGACLLGAREVGELPLVIWWGLHRARRGERASDPRANWLGKLATVLQFLAIAALLTDGGRAWPWLALTAVTGAASAVLYWRRELGAGSLALR